MYGSSTVKGIEFDSLFGSRESTRTTNKIRIQFRFQEMEIIFMKTLL